MEICLLEGLRFKTVRLTAIRNEPKHKIFASGGLRLLQMVLDPIMGQSVNENARTLDLKG